MTAEFAPALLPTCTQSAKLPRALYDVVTALGPDTVNPYAVETDLPCILQAHTAGNHQGFVVELISADCGSAWTLWADGQQPTEILIRTDCPISQDGEACCSYAGHPGGHTYEITNPLYHPAQHGHQR